jgi:galactokinase
MLVVPQNINPPLRLLAVIPKHLHREADFIVQAPGRDLWLAGVKWAEPTVQVAVPEVSAKTHFDYHSARRKQTLMNRPLPGWSRYVAGAYLRLQEDGLNVPGLSVFAISDEPAGPGFAFGLGMAFVMAACLLTDYNINDMEIRLMVESIRREYVEG